jgi:hypothetical protein
MSEMRVKLDKALKDHNRSAEEQEKTIEWVISTEGLGSS